MAPHIDELMEDDVVCEPGYITMDDGVRLAYVVWRRPDAMPCPVLLQYSVYDDCAMTYSAAKEFLKAGYAVMGANVRGCGCSEGANFRPYASSEGPDGAQLIQWAAAQPWSSGAVGMIGNSNAGIKAWLVGKQQPPALKVIAVGGVADNSYADFVKGGMLQQFYCGVWALGGQQASGKIAAKRRIKEWNDQECAQIIKLQQPYDLYDVIRKHPLYDEWWQQNLIPQDLFAQVYIPTLMVAGFQDEATAAAMTASRAFSTRLAHVEHKRLILTNGGHASYKLAPIVAETIRWLDRWLKDDDNGVEHEPPVKVFWETKVPGTDFSSNYEVSDADLSRSEPGWTTSYATWPVPNLHRTVFYLTGDAKLSVSQPTSNIEQSVRRYLYPTGTELVGSNQHFALKSAEPGSLHYRSEPMGEDMAILGNPEIILFVASEQTDADLVVNLKDIDVDGNTTYLTRGMLRASLRQVDGARSGPDEVIHTYAESQKMLPGEVYEVRFSLSMIAQVVRKGHRLEVSVLAPNDIPSPWVSSSPIGSSSVIKVHHSEHSQSRLIIPFLPGEKARLPVPACGSLWYQPCRKHDPVVDESFGGLDF